MGFFFLEKLNNGLSTTTIYLLLLWDGLFDKEGAGQHSTREGGVEYKRGDARAFGR